MIHSPEPSVKLNSPDHVRIAVERLTLENHELRQMNAFLSRSNQDLSGLLSRAADSADRVTDQMSVKQ